ncbi:hypothetical protein HYDPIDRAFT_28996 [Hydnomerulius pinastri MD-312]|uniref:F-box domain-containing protein n=1 Tax=Hydnomerulius pinastri MD-312 TaxID=994086 RepID=A0A0C9WFC7_9AGAM|nr:hypothetical protein HYDPIDRAFT_28996 [Hydnomerulius pinastri MD-312]
MPTPSSSVSHRYLPQASPATLDRWQEILSRAPIYELIFACLSPRTLVRVSVTCRAAYLAVAAFKHRAFNINRHLSKYFKDPLAFRSLQAATGTLISGSNALQFLDRTHYPESDLDLYTHPGHAFEVCKWLIEAEGYRFAPRETQEQEWEKEIKDDWDGTERRITRSQDPMSEEAYPLQGLAAVYTFKKYHGPTQDQLVIQVIHSRGSPLQLILAFHSTCVMNFITFDAAHSLYPIATFEERRSLGMPNSRSTTESALDKYIRRGWRIFFLPTPLDTTNPTKPPFMLNETRWVSDRYTWVMPLDMTGVRERPPPNPYSQALSADPVVYNGWKLKPPISFEQGYACSYHSLQTTIFRYNYVLPDEHLCLKMRAWANEQGKLSHRQFSKDNWVWFDEVIPGFAVQAS